MTTETIIESIKRKAIHEVMSTVLKEAATKIKEHVRIEDLPRNVSIDVELGSVEDNRYLEITCKVIGRLP